MSKVVTVRISPELDDQLMLLAKEIGLSKSAMMRVAIMKYLDVDNIGDYCQITVNSDNSRRINVILTQILQSIVEDQAKKLNTTANSLINYACYKIVDHYMSFLA